MKLFRTKPELAEMKDLQEIKETIQTLEKMLGEIRHIIGHRRTMIKNADKKLQEFQDTIYAMLIEEEYPRKKSYRVQDNSDEQQAR